MIPTENVFYNRALVSDAQIVCCDEITSALDAETETLVMNTLYSTLRGKAVLLIAHRLSTVRAADEILFLDEGKIVERGSHEDLMDFSDHKNLGQRYSSFLKSADSFENAR